MIASSLSAIRLGRFEVNFFFVQKSRVMRHRTTPEGNVKPVQKYFAPIHKRSDLCLALGSNEPAERNIFQRDKVSRRGSSGGIFAQSPSMEGL